MLHIALPHETVYNPAGRVTTIHHHSAAEYDPFGEPIIAPIGTAYGFTGELTDGSGWCICAIRGRGTAARGSRGM